MINDGSVWNIMKHLHANKVTSPVWGYGFSCPFEPYSTSHTHIYLGGAGLGVSPVLGHIRGHDMLLVSTPSPTRNAC